MEQCAYITLKSKKRMLGRINSRISKLNRYYNAPTELFARFVELYFLLPLKTKEIAPNAYFLFELALKDNKLPELAELSKILEKL